ncbi:hypothetical protein AOLI_G00169380 [Acnodon oligacanthus]
MVPQETLITSDVWKKDMLKVEVSGAECLPVHAPPPALPHWKASSPLAVIFELGPAVNALGTAVTIISSLAIFTTPLLLAVLGEAVVYDVLPLG